MTEIEVTEGMKADGANFLAKALFQTPEQRAVGCYQRMAALDPSRLQPLPTSADELARVMHDIDLCRWKRNSVPFEGLTEYWQKYLLNLAEGLIARYGRPAEPPADQSVANLQRTIDTLLEQFAAARAEVDLMRPVYDAAVTYCVMLKGVGSQRHNLTHPGRVLWDACEAAIASSPPATPSPEQLAEREARKAVEQRVTRENIDLYIAADDALKASGRERL